MITQELQQLSQASPLIDLFALDLTKFSLPTYRFTPHVRTPAVIYQGFTYSSLPIQLSGYEAANTGKLPRPTLSLSRVGANAILDAVITFGDIVGAPVLRLRTFEKFLDNGSAPNNTAFLGPDTFFVQRKLAQTRDLLSFELVTALEWQGLALPRGQALKDPTPYNPGGFPGLDAFRVR